MATTGRNPARKAKAIADGKCTSCYCRPKADGRNTCLGCLARHKAQRDKAKAEGRCIRCFSDRHHGPYATCDECLNADKLKRDPINPKCIRCRERIPMLGMLHCGVCDEILEGV